MGIPTRSTRRRGSSPGSTPVRAISSRTSERVASAPKTPIRRTSSSSPSHVTRCVARYFLSLSAFALVEIWGEWVENVRCFHALLVRSNCGLIVEGEIVGDLVLVNDMANMVNKSGGNSYFMS